MSNENILDEEIKVVLDDDSNSNDSILSDIEASLIKEAIVKAQNDADTEKEHSDSEFDSDSESDGAAPIKLEKLVLDEEGYSDPDPLPAGWTYIQHASGLKIYINYPEKVCTTARPYFLGTGSVRKHNIPRSAIPCLSYLFKPEDSVPVVENTVTETKDKIKPNLEPEVEASVNNLDIVISAENLKNTIPVQKEVTHIENRTPAENVSTLANVSKKQNIELSQIIVFDANFCVDNDGKKTENATLVHEDSSPVENATSLTSLENVCTEQNITTVDIFESDDEVNWDVRKDSILVEDDDTNVIEVIEDGNATLETMEDILMQEEQHEVVFFDEDAMQEVVIFMENDSEEHVAVQEYIPMEEDDCTIVEVLTNDDVVLDNNAEVLERISIGATDKDDDVDIKETEEQVYTQEEVVVQNETVLEVPGIKDNAIVQNDVVVAGTDIVDERVSFVENAPLDPIKHVTAEELETYCSKLFHFKKIHVMRFNSWSERRQFSKRRKHVHQLHKTAPLEPKVIIKCPVQSKGGASSKKWLMNTSGKSHVCILHEYLQHSLRKQPKYSFSELENAATPYAATVTINDMKYGVGYGTSKKQAKSYAAIATLEILIPEMDNNRKLTEDGTIATTKNGSDNSNIAFFDTISIVDPRVTEFSAKTRELLPFDLLKSCLKRNKDLGEMKITYEDDREDKAKEVKFTMTVGEHQVTVLCKNKREAKQQAAQAILQNLHPHVHSWGALLRLYGISGCTDLKEKLTKKTTDQIPLLLASQELQLVSHTPTCNATILSDLKDKFNSFKMRGLKRDYDENVRPLLIVDITNTVLE